MRLVAGKYLGIFEFDMNLKNEVNEHIHFLFLFLGILTAMMQSLLHKCTNCACQLRISLTIYAYGYLSSASFLLQNVRTSSSIFIV